jgi:protein translocase SecG subunit
MKNVLIIAQIITGITLITLIFFQSEGSDESRANILTTTNFEKRGWEKITFQLTIITLVIFLILSIAQTLL